MAAIPIMEGDVTVVINELQREGVKNRWQDRKRW
jgi:hypothetical protein